MKLIMKQILIVVSSFFIIFWLQKKEDKRTNRVRNTPYERFKFPLLVSSMVGLLFTMKEFICSNDMNESTVVIPDEVEMPKEFIPMKKQLETISEVGGSNKGNFSRNSLSDFDQEIDLSPPDF
jgi:hypothetical protein